MVVASPGREVIRFGPFEVDRQTGELCRGNLKIRLQEQPLQILLLLLERRGGLVTREELRERLWSDGTIVDFDHSLKASALTCMGLGDSDQAFAWLEKDVENHGPVYMIKPTLAGTFCTLIRAIGICCAASGFLINSAMQNEVPCPHADPSP